MAREVITGLYEFDPYGTNPDNLILNEKQVVTPAQRDDYHFIIPLAAPFYLGDFELFNDTTGEPLQLGVDYVLGHRFPEAMNVTGRKIYGSIRFINRTYQGIVRIKYRTLGGEWGFNSQAILEELARRAYNPVRRAWGSIAPMPVAFPPVDHDQDFNEVVGVEALIAAINQIATALGETEAGDFNNHIINRENPHNVTATQVGLGNVSNFTTATQLQAEAGTANNAFMTPLRTAQSVAALVGNSFTNHLNDRENPHEVTAFQIGLGNVQDFGVATVTEAREGTVSNKYMTPERTRDFLVALGFQSWDNHLINTENPHNTSAEQVGLGNVSNYQTATDEEAQEGTRADRFMTPAGVRLLVQGLGIGDLSGHINDRENPHEVSADQVGLGNVSNYPTATVVEARTGEATDRFMTPAGVRAFVENLNFGNLNEHLEDRENPHEVSAEQVGLGNVDNFTTATETETIAGERTDAWTTPAGIAALIEHLGITAHQENQENPHNVTADQVGAITPEALALALEDYLGPNDTAANANRVYNYDFETLQTEILTGTANNSQRFNGETYQEFIEGLSEVSVGDSERFGGRTAEEFTRDLPVALSAVVAYRIDPTSVPEGESIQVLSRVNDEFTDVLDGYSFLVSGYIEDAPVYCRVDVGLEDTQTRVVELAGSAATLLVHTTFDVETDTLTVWLENNGFASDITVLPMAVSDAGTRVIVNDVTVSDDFNGESPVAATFISPLRNAIEQAFNAATDDLVL